MRLECPPEGLNAGLIDPALKGHPPKEEGTKQGKKRIDPAGA
jgi:hypothetical protein